ncbi:MAG: hypothetical protein IMX02_09025 [Limnochordaceae bacterium]|uniref:Uncharacterized protein n=1 Tax=Carboxydichorda subterranea TaxID=3109565 RepID=A0ABZ1BYE1_9FIRM|nr:hypothetical protein [Limnochorda sp. L945t]MBE3598912.1 hypothetical protein [Limnochordaceae bacterium]WRP17831.1 hypothetical protein U7230_02125 [Limnochorda sp. L945t]
MGLRQWLDALMGRPRLVQAKPEKLFALSTARTTLEQELGWIPQGRAGICLKPVVTADYASAQQELAELVRLGAEETKSRVELQRDSFGYTWMIAEDPEFEDLVTLVHMAADTLEEKGFGTQILSAVFRFRLADAVRGMAGMGSESTAPERIYLIYNYKRGRFYPFVPKGPGKGPADGRYESGELHASATLSRELPIEPDPSRWYPLWDCPV